MIDLDWTIEEEEYFNQMHPVEQRWIVQQDWREQYEEDLRKQNEKLNSNIHHIINGDY